FYSDLGWAIGRGESYANLDTQDDIESQAFYELLEQQIVPMFYDRDQAGVPQLWVERMKRCIATLAPRFNTNRMLQEYAEKLYLPALKRARALGADNLQPAVAFAHQKDRLRAAWNKIRIENVEMRGAASLSVRQELAVSAVVNVDNLEPSELRVQVYMGPLNNDGRIIEGEAIDLTYK